MLYHPPILYLGLTGLAVPWAATVGAGLDRRADGAWAGRLRRQLLAVVGVLTVGMVAGAHWAYVELGWGGFWAWDPVENTALLPWLAALGMAASSLVVTLNALRLARPARASGRGARERTRKFRRSLRASNPAGPSARRLRGTIA